MATNPDGTTRCDIVRSGASKVRATVESLCLPTAGHHVLASEAKPRYSPCRYMTVFIALLRAINVGGTGKLSMSELRASCEKAGFRNVKTYIQSGNVLFETALSESALKTKLEKVLAAKVGKPVGVIVRTRLELDAVAKENPFDKAEPARLVVLFLDEAPAKTALAQVVIPGREEVKLGRREVYVHYPDGQGQSKLKLAEFKTGTGRNLNTVLKLASLAREMEDGSTP